MGDPSRARANGAHVGHDEDWGDEGEFSFLKIVREQGPVKPIVSAEKADSIATADFLKRNPDLKDKPCIVEKRLLAYVPKTGAPNRRVPVWSLTLKVNRRISEGMRHDEPVIYNCVLDAWTGKILNTERPAPPPSAPKGAQFPPPQPPSPKNNKPSTDSKPVNSN